MSAISDFSDRVAASFTQISIGIDGVTADVAMLKDLIEQLQNSPGAISPEDQALLDEMESLAANLSARITALDEATQPPV